MSIMGRVREDPVDGGYLRFPLNTAKWREKLHDVGGESAWDKESSDGGAEEAHREKVKKARLEDEARTKKPHVKQAGRLGIPNNFKPPEMLRNFR